jgi:hypothetical protein
VIGSSTRIWAPIVCLCGLSILARAQQQPVVSIRPPATPLVVHDPYFSIWSDVDRLTDGPTRHWTGVLQPLNGLVRVDSKTYRYLGNADRPIPAMAETDRKITPTRTVVTLQSPEIELTLMFLSRFIWMPMEHSPPIAAMSLSIGRVRRSKDFTCSVSAPRDNQFLKSMEITCG